MDLYRRCFVWFFSVPVFQRYWNRGALREESGRRLEGERLGVQSVAVGSHCAGPSASEGEALFEEWACGARELRLLQRETGEAPAWAVDPFGPPPQGVCGRVEGERRAVRAPTGQRDGHVCPPAPAVGGCEGAADELELRVAWSRDQGRDRSQERNRSWVD